MEDSELLLRSKPNRVKWWCWLYWVVETCEELRRQYERMGDPTGCAKVELRFEHQKRLMEKKGTSFHVVHKDHLQHVPEGGFPGNEHPP